MSQLSAQPRRAAAQITHSGVPIIDAQQIAIAVQSGGYRTSVLSRPSRCVIVIAIIGQSVVPRLLR